MSAGGLQKRLLLLPSEGCAFRLPSLQKLCCGCGGRGAWGCAIPYFSALSFERALWEKQTKYSKQTNNTFCYYLVNKDLKIQISAKLFFVKSISRKKFREIGWLFKIVFGTQWVLYNSKKRRGRSKDQPHQRLVSTAVTSLIQGPDSWTVKPPPEKDENFLFNCCWRLRACVWFHEKNGDVAHTYS